MCKAVEASRGIVERAVGASCEALRKWSKGFVQHVMVEFNVSLTSSFHSPLRSLSYMAYNSPPY